jgi:hypothetical protein
MLYGIPAHLIDEVWDEVRPWIERACSRNRGKYDADDIRTGLASGEDQLWVWKSPTAFAVGITRLSNYPKQRVCTIRIATGTNSREWRDEAVRTIEKWAKANGCDAMELCARKGWARHLKGYDMTHVYLEKPL